MFQRDLVSPKMLMLVTKRENANRCSEGLSPCRRSDEFHGGRTSLPAPDIKGEAAERLTPLVRAFY